MLKMFHESKNCNDAVRRFCKSALPSSIDEELRGGFGQLLNRGFNVEIAGFGAGVTEHAVRSREFSISNISDDLEKFTVNNCPGGTYYILFDELDEDYKDILIKPDHKDKFFQLLTSLFKAVQDIRYKTRGRNFNFIPLIFLRSDIYDLLRDPDKNKWRDRVIDLNWSESGLRRLLTYRISKAIDADGAMLSFDEAWRMIFSANFTRYGKGKKSSKETFLYILDSTYLRPRDLISYVRECAKSAIENEEDIISNVEIKEATELHSLYMQRELVDEMQSVVDDIEEIFGIFTDLHKINLNYNNLITKITSYINDSGRQKDGLSAESIVDLLFYFGVVGNISPGGKKTFSYHGNHIRLRKNETLCLHRSLLKGLQIW